MNIIFEFNNKPMKPWCRLDVSNKVFGASCGLIGLFIVPGDVIELGAKYKKECNELKKQLEQLQKC